MHRATLRNVAGAGGVGQVLEREPPLDQDAQAARSWILEDYLPVADVHSSSIRGVVCA